MEKDFETAAKWLKLSADQGLADAQTTLGEAYMSGLLGDRNHKEAFRLIKQAADQGHSSAAFDLASCYRFAIGTKEDPEAAFRWMKVAADSGLRAAKMKLAGCYLEGYGVARDAAVAEQLIREAEAVGDSRRAPSLSGSPSSHPTWTGPCQALGHAAFQVEPMYRIRYNAEHAPFAFAK